MLTHKQIWAAIDELASRYGHTASGLARRAGLDATTFNPSKRVGADGKERWPSTESVSKVLKATGASLDEFVTLMAKGTPPLRGSRSVPLVGFAQAGSKGYFDDAGFPAGEGWDAVEFPGISDDNAYALEVSGQSMEPLYRDGDVVVVSPAAQIRRGDRVVVKTLGGEVMVKELTRRTAKRIELKSVNPAYEDRSIETADIAWIARIIWASQ
jgi:phage repressor protein C with HTH and peptisase S24 domain